MDDLCRSGDGHGGNILTPQAENKKCQSVGSRSTWKMQSWLESAYVAFAVCIVQQLRSRYILYVVRGRLHSTVCMARCGIRDAFVWFVQVRNDRRPRAVLRHGCK